MQNFAERTAELSTVSLALDRRRPVAEQVYETLKRAIVELRLLPGTAISENSLGQQLSVSRTPIRAAILRLSEEGLIDVFPQQGSFVSLIRISDLKDSQFVRRSLEVALVTEAAAQWSERASARLHAIVEDQRAAIAADDFDGFHREDEAFHQAFAEIAGRKGVWPSVLAAKTNLTRFIRFSGDRQRLPAVIEEHLAILAALDRGDATAAGAAMAAHLDRIFLLFENPPEKDRAYFTT